MTIDIRPTDLECLKKHTEACWPEEACALLIGQYVQNQHWIVNHVELAENIAENKSRYFEIDPTSRVKVEMNMLSEIDEVIGIFHSHPEGQATLSDTDLKNMTEPDLFWLIANTASGKVKEFCAFTAADGQKINQLTLHSKYAANGDEFI
jgi:proteasome lid subunit RPN8/RPN11